jgi:hypothetical protein
MNYRWLALLLCILVPGVALATTVRLQSERQMTAAAAAIARGTVLSVTPRRHSSGLVVTDVTLRVERLLKAAAPVSTLVFTQLGGTLDGKTLHVPGQSSFTVGEEVLVFLERGGDSLVEMGVGAGKYRVLREPGGAAIERQLGRLAFAVVDGRKATRVQPPPVTGPEPLDVFEARIAAFLVE